MNSWKPRVSVIKLESAKVLKVRRLSFKVLVMLDLTLEDTCRKQEDMLLVLLRRIVVFTTLQDLMFMRLIISKIREPR